PGTYRLTAGRSTVELSGIMRFSPPVWGNEQSVPQPSGKSSRISKTLSGLQRLRFPHYNGIWGGRSSGAGKAGEDVWDPRSYEDTDYGLEAGESFEPEDAWDVETGVSTDGPHVMTLLGPIDSIELGVCLHHVHLLCDPVAVSKDDPDYRLDDE